MLGTRTRGGRMEGSDESNELLRHPYSHQILHSLVATGLQGQAECRKFAKVLNILDLMRLAQLPYHHEVVGSYTDIAKTTWKQTAMKTKTFNNSFVITITIKILHFFIEEMP